MNYLLTRYTHRDMEKKITKIAILLSNIKTRGK